MTTNDTQPDRTEGSESDQTGVKRRGFIAGIGSAGAVAIGGCTGSESEPNPAGGNAEGTPEPDGGYDPEQIRDEAGYIPYDELFRNIESHQGQAVHYPWAEVLQAFYEEPHVYRFDVGRNPSGSLTDVYSEYSGEGRLIEDDMVELWAVVEGVTTYETVMGDERTVPHLTLVDFEEYETQRTAELAIGDTYRSPLDVLVTVIDVELLDAYEYEDFNGEIVQAEPDDGAQWCFVIFDATNDSGSTEWLPSDRDVSVLAGNSQYEQETLFDEPVNLDYDAYESDEVQDGVIRTGWIAYQIPNDLSLEDITVVWSSDTVNLQWTVRWTA